jgi:hypothetical protein
MSQGNTEWYAGLPFAGQRKLEPSEQQTLRRAARRLRWKGFGALLAFPLLLILSGVASDYLDATSPPFVQSLFADWMYFLFLGFLPLELLFVRDALHRGKGLRADLKKGFVKCYAGPFRSLPETDETVLRLKKKELLPSTLGTDWSLEALPETGRIYGR